jgi:predicted RNase H-like HicB family nuclease
MKCAIVTERSENNYSAYAPDLPGCVATGQTVAEIEAEMESAIEFHLEGLRADGLAIPEPTSIVEYGSGPPATRTPVRGGAAPTAVCWMSSLIGRRFAAADFGGVSALSPDPSSASGRGELRYCS